MNSNLLPFDFSSSDSRQAWLIVELQASMIDDQKVLIELLRQQCHAAIGLANEREKQLQRVLRSAFPVN